MRFAPLFSGQLYYGLLVPFLPSEGRSRGVSIHLVGFIIACHAVGLILCSFVAPQMLRYVGALVMLRAVLLFMATASLCASMTGMLSGALFASLLGLCRLVMGAAVSIVEVCVQSILFQCMPAHHAPTVMSVLLFVRSAGLLLGPLVGGLLYPISIGHGFSLALLAPSIVFLFVYIALFSIGAYSKNIRPSIKTASVTQVLTVCKMWPGLIGTPLAGFFLPLMLEPLYEPVFRAPPYGFTVRMVGVVASMPAAGMMVGQAVGMVGLLLFMRPSIQQACGAALLIFGSVVLGWATETGIAIAGLLMIGSGFGICLSAQPAMSLRILWRDAGLTKNDVGGALSATSTMFEQISTLVAPTIGPYVEDGFGFQWLCYGWAIFYFLLFAICWFLLLPYGLDDSRSPSMKGEPPPGAGKQS